MINLMLWHFFLYTPYKPLWIIMYKCCMYKKRSGFPAQTICFRLMVNSGDFCLLFSHSEPEPEPEHQCSSVQNSFSVRQHLNAFKVSRQSSAELKETSPLPLCARSVWASSAPLCISSPDTSPSLWFTAKPKTTATTSHVSLCCIRK